MQTSNKQLENTLLNIGFNEKEAKIYLALLELGPSDAKSISVKSGLKKPTTYVILDELRQKDAVLFLPNAKKKLFSAKNPEEIFNQAQKRMRQAIANLPLLSSLSKTSKDKAMVTYYEGKTGYTQAMTYKMEESIASGETLSYFSSADKVSPLMIEKVNEHLLKLKKNKIKIRAFAPENENLKEYRKSDKDFYREVKVLPKELFSAHSSIEIGRSFVRFALFEQEMFVIIDNTEIAKVMRQIFEMNWSKY